MDTDQAQRTARRICPFCEATCGLVLQIEGNRVLSVRGDTDDVFSRGYMCPKGVALKDLHDDPDRLRTPLVRRNGELVEATWDEAFAEIERVLVPIRDAHGPHAAGLCFGNPTAHKLGLLRYMGKLARGFATRNVFSATTLDQMPKYLSSGLMFGHWLNIAVPDIERCDYLLILGANPMASNGSMWTVPDFRDKAKAMKARGGRMVVVDPRRNETAAVADEHHFICPGADVFLLAAIANCIVSQGVTSLGRLEAHVSGLEELRRALGAFTPEFSAGHSGVPADTIRKIAVELSPTLPVPGARNQVVELRLENSRAA
jgi:anaerobic selenocysteine-containing dehydrogenase